MNKAIIFTQSASIAFACAVVSYIIIYRAIKK